MQNNPVEGEEIGEQSDSGVPTIRMQVQRWSDHGGWDSSGFDEAYHIHWLMQLIIIIECSAIPKSITLVGVIITKDGCYLRPLPLPAVNIDDGVDDMVPGGGVTPAAAAAAAADVFIKTIPPGVTTDDGPIGN